MTFSACFVFIFSHFKWLNILTRNEPSLCVCVCVYVCVCVFLSVQANNFPNCRPILMKLGPHDYKQNLRWHFSQILKILLWWRHSGYFVRFAIRHSHGRNFSPIFFKITDNVQLSLPMFGIGNQQDRSITFGRKSGRRSSHIAALVSEPDSEVAGSNPGGGTFFCDYECF